MLTDKFFWQIENSDKTEGMSEDEQHTWLAYLFLV